MPVGPDHQGRQNRHTTTSSITRSATVSTKTVCEEPKQVTATGTVKEVKVKMEMTATKIEEVKEVK